MTTKTTCSVIDERGEGAEPRLALLMDIAGALEARRLPYAVLNGYDPETGVLGRDVDIIVEKGDMEQILEVCHAKGRAHGWPYLSGRWVGYWWPRGLYQLAFHRAEGGRVQNLALDLICSDGLAAGLVPVYSGDLLGTDRDVSSGIAVTPVGSYMKHLIRILAGNGKGIAQAHALGSVPDGAKASIASLLGEPFLRHYEKSVKEGSLSREWRALRQKAQRAYWSRFPLRALKNTLTSLSRRAIGSRMSRITTIAIVGPDEARNRAAIERTSAHLESAFVTLRQRNLRPELLPELSCTKRSSLSAPFRQLYYYADYVLGYLLKDRFYTSADFLVNLYNGCALNLQVDPSCYGLEETRWNAWLYRLSPKPDCVILLTDTAKVMHARAPERPYEEIERQLCEWRGLHEKALIHDVIKVAGRSNEEIGWDIAITILKQISTKHSIERVASSQAHKPPRLLEP